MIASTISLLGVASRNASPLLTFEQKEAFLYFFAIAVALAGLSYFCEVCGKGLIWLWSNVWRKVKSNK